MYGRKGKNHTDGQHNALCLCMRQVFVAGLYLQDCSSLVYVRISFHQSVPPSLKHANVYRRFWAITGQIPESYRQSDPISSSQSKSKCALLGAL